MHMVQLGWAMARKVVGSNLEQVTAEKPYVNPGLNSDPCFESF